MQHMRKAKNTFEIAAVSVAMMLLPATGFAAGGQTQSEAMQVARGAQAWQENCGRCHNYRSPSEFSDKNWHVIVNHMRVIAPLPGATARDIEAFLKSSNGS